MSGLAIRYGQISQQFLVGHFRRVTRWFRRGGAARPLWVPCFFVEKQQTGGRGTHLKVTDTQHIGHCRNTLTHKVY